MYSKNPKNIAYDNKGQDRDHNIYTEEFLGGADTFIYVNGERYNDISAIQYAIREQVKPVYGYSSRIYDDIVSGVRIVQGIIKVPVRNTLANESLTSVSTTESVSGGRGRISIDVAPDWVYNYSPKISSENNLDIPNNYTISPKERINIINYNKENGMEINFKSNLNTLNNKDMQNIILEKVSLKYEPNEDSIYTLGQLEKGSVIKIIDSINSYYLIEDLDTNRIGYVEKNKVEVV